MKKLSLIVFTLLVVGCNGESSENRVEINRVEKHITNSNSSIGCKGKSQRECSEHKSIDSADYILKSLSQQESVSKSGIKDGLEDLVEKRDRVDVKKNLTKLVENAPKNIEDEHEKKIATPPRIEKDVRLIKSSLEELVNSSDHKKALKIKKEIDKLVEKSVEKKDVKKTKETLEHLVDEIEHEKSKERRREIKSLIGDIATKRVNLIEESDKYFIMEVRKGDTLGGIAKRYYGDGSKFRLIYEANKDKIGKNYEIYPKTKLKIPKI
jgi:LysM repeat protein